MKIRTDGRDGFELSTGRTFYSYGEFIGISPNVDDDGDLRIVGGFDDEIYYKYQPFDDYDNDFTKEECVELANYMIDLWTKFKNANIYKKPG